MNEIEERDAICSAALDAVEHVRLAKPDMCIASLRVALALAERWELRWTQERRRQSSMRRP